MIAPDKVCAILLAAGLSRRFGAADKLDAMLGGTPLRLHAGATLAGIGFARSIAVCAAEDAALAGLGFEIVINPRPEDGQGSSIACGIAALTHPADAILVALADMPAITAGHLNALLAAFRPGTIVASHDGMRTMPPALFDASYREQLGALTGDSGARHLLASAILVAAPPELLADIDTPDQL